MLFLPGGKKQKLGRIRITQMLFSGVKKASKENHLDIFWQTQKQLENITQMHFSGGEKSI